MGKEGVLVSSSADGLTLLSLAVSEVNPQGISVGLWEVPFLAAFCDFSGKSFQSLDCLPHSALTAEVPLARAHP